MDFHLEPHEDFVITKYLLEEDNDSVPLIEIETGEDQFPDDFDQDIDLSS